MLLSSNLLSSRLVVAIDLCHSANRTDQGDIMQGLSDPTDEAQAVHIRYRNYRGETTVRRIRPSHIRFAATTWHPQPQWLLEAIDLDKHAERSFAMSDILDFNSSEQDVSY
jgi:predicted DNA-binding transcriptional regulator YafY